MTFQELFTEVFFWGGGRERYKYVSSSISPHNGKTHLFSKKLFYQKLRGNCPVDVDTTIGALQTFQNKEIYKKVQNLLQQQERTEEENFPSNIKHNTLELSKESFA